MLDIDLGNRRVDETSPGIALSMADLGLSVELIVVFGEHGDVLVKKVCGRG